MKKHFSFVIFAVLFSLMPFMSVNAESREVTSQEELKAALADSTIDTIVISNDFQTTEKIDISRPVVIDGNNHKIAYGNSLGSTWTDVYVLHFYKTTATVKNITLTGAEGAINVDGSVVTLEGTIDVSGNRAGGIKLGMDNGVTSTPDVTTDGATIINTTETSTAPTVWIDVDFEGIDTGDTSDVDDYDMEDWPFKGAAYIGNKGQVHLFLSRDNVPTGEDIIDLSDELTSNDDTTDSKDDPSGAQNREVDVVVDDNPNTFDGMIYYLVFAILSFVVLGYSYTKATSR